MPSYWLIVTSENDHVLQLTAASASEEAQAKQQPRDQKNFDRQNLSESSAHQQVLASSGSPQQPSRAGNVFLNPFQEFESFHGRGLAWGVERHRLLA